MRAIRSRTNAGVAVASLTMMNLSPTITPEFGSPSAVYAQQCALSCSKVIFLSARSAWLANAFVDMARILGAQCAGGGRRGLIQGSQGVDHDDTRLTRRVFEGGELARDEARR